MFVSFVQVERQQEGDHSRIHRASSLRRVGGPYVSMLLRMPEILKVFQAGDSGDSSANFLREFVRILDPDQLAKRLGFFNHPLYLEAVRDKQTFQERRQIAKLCMCSLDIVAQHSRQEARTRKRLRKKRQKDNAIEKWSAGLRASVPFSADVVEQQALAEHLQASIANQPRSLLLSVPCGNSAQPLPVRTLSASLDIADHRADQLALELDVEPDLASNAVPTSDMTFFKVVPLRADRQKLVPMPAAHARRIRQHQLCVTMHHSRKVGASYLVAVEASRATSVQGPVSVLSVCDANLEATRQHMQAWFRRKSSCYVLENVNDAVARRVEDSVSKLVACRAFPNTGQFLHVAQSDVSMIEQLELLQGLSLVCRSQEGPDSDASEWGFTVLGASRLRAATHVRSPEPVFQALTDMSQETLEAATSWQLFDALRRLGFQVRRKPKDKKAVLRLPRHTPQNLDLLWYIPNTSLSRCHAYMIALLRSEELFQGGTLTQVLHCQSAQYYQMILDGNHSGDALVALEDQPRAALSLDVESWQLPAQSGQQSENDAVVRSCKRARHDVVDHPAVLAALVDEDADITGGLSSESLSPAALFCAWR